MRIKTIFVQNLRKYRKQRKISQMLLAEKCGTSTAYIGQIEIGNRFPSLEMIEKISVALQIKPYMFFLDEPDEENEIAKEKLLSEKKTSIPDSTKDELIKNLTSAINRIVRRIK